MMTPATSIHYHSSNNPPYGATVVAAPSTATTTTTCQSLDTDLGTVRGKIKNRPNTSTLSLSTSALSSISESANRALGAISSSNILQQTQMLRSSRQLLLRHPATVSPQTQPQQGEISVSSSASLAVSGGSHQHQQQ